MTSPKRGEIWLVDLNPARGQEIQKTPPVVVIAVDRNLRTSGKSYRKG
jgi:mRNA interferase MazF